jgi:hypothetical protein
MSMKPKFDGHYTIFLFDKDGKSAHIKNLDTGHQTRELHNGECIKFIVVWKNNPETTNYVFLIILNNSKQKTFLMLFTYLPHDF